MSCERSQGHKLGALACQPLTGNVSAHDGPDCQVGSMWGRELLSRSSIGELAEAVRFELTGPCEPPVFKTGAIDHSATLPALRAF